VAITASPELYGLTAGFVTAITDACDEYDQELKGHVAKRAEAKAQTALKDQKRIALDRLLRETKTTAKAAKAGEARIASLGIPTKSQAAPANATIPFASVDTSERMRHTVRWQDANFSHTKRKPRGAMGAEIWVKIGDPMPLSEKECTFLTVAASSPYIAEYPGADAGRPAHYLLRWRMRDGSTSGWSETVTATITG
jgi:hypothetical protein